MLVDRKCNDCNYVAIDRLENRGTFDTECIECPACKKKSLKKQVALTSFVVAGFRYSNGYGGSK